MHSMKYTQYQIYGRTNRCSHFHLLFTFISLTQHFRASVYIWRMKKQHLKTTQLYWEIHWRCIAHICNTAAEWSFYYLESVGIFEGVICIFKNGLELYWIMVAVACECFHNSMWKKRIEITYFNCASILRACARLVLFCFQLVFAACTVCLLNYFIFIVFSLYTVFVFYLSFARFVSLSISFFVVVLLIVSVPSELNSFVDRKNNCLIVPFSSVKN